jgi:hypothetical protein
VSGAPPTEWEERWGHFMWPATPRGPRPPLYKVGGSSLHKTRLSWQSLSLLPLAAPPKRQWLERSPTESISPPSSLSWSVIGVLGGSSTSAAPLEWVYGGRHRSERVTEYGGATRCGAHLHDLEISKWSTISSMFVRGCFPLLVYEGESF